MPKTKIKRDKKTGKFGSSRGKANLVPINRVPVQSPELGTYWKNRKASARLSERLASGGVPQLRTKPKTVKDANKKTNRKETND